MNQGLIDAINGMVNQAYPEFWKAEWLPLPLLEGSSRSEYHFNVICSDLPRVREGKNKWPPTSSNPKTWIQWERERGVGFWIRPRQFDPIVRDRLILVRPAEIFDPQQRSKFDYESVVDACYFAAESQRIVWHNPPKGGARKPQSSHFQSIPLYRNKGSSRSHTFPVCLYSAGHESWQGRTETAVQLLERGIDRSRYPVLGLAVSGEIESVAAFVWKVIWEYDRAEACNLVIQPDDVSDQHTVIRVFVFPRSRTVSNHTVKEELLEDNEKILMKNNRGGVWSAWSFAGVEMALLTQVEWGPVFEKMSAEPEGWGETLLRLLSELTLGESDDDWLAFVRIVDRLSSKIKSTN